MSTVLYRLAHGFDWDRDDYYAERGEAPGEWVGGAAEALGLSGRVRGEQFNALVAGMDPRDPSVRLLSVERDPEIAALDLTFSAPKSVSVLAAVAPEDVARELVAAHEEALRAAPPMRLAAGGRGGRHDEH